MDERASLVCHIHREHGRKKDDTSCDTGPWETGSNCERILYRSFYPRSVASTTRCLLCILSKVRCSCLLSPSFPSLFVILSAFFYGFLTRVRRPYSFISQLALLVHSVGVSPKRRHASAYTGIYVRRRGLFRLIVSCIFSVLFPLFFPTYFSFYNSKICDS